MTDSLFKLFASALGIWEHKEKTKYIDKLLRLQRKYYEEINKDRVDMAVTDNIEHELRVLSDAFNTALAKSHTEN